MHAAPTQWKTLRFELGQAEFTLSRTGDACAPDKLAVALRITAAAEAMAQNTTVDWGVRPKSAHGVYASDAPQGTKLKLRRPQSSAGLRDVLPLEMSTKLRRPQSSTGLREVLPLEMSTTMMLKRCLTAPCGVKRLPNITSERIPMKAQLLQPNLHYSYPFVP